MPKPDSVLVLSDKTAHTVKGAGPNGPHHQYDRQVMSNKKRSVEDKKCDLSGKHVLPRELPKASYHFRIEDLLPFSKVNFKNDRTNCQTYFLR